MCCVECWFLHRVSVSFFLADLLCCLVRSWHQVGGGGGGKGKCQCARLMWAVTDVRGGHDAELLSGEYIYIYKEDPL